MKISSISFCISLALCLIHLSAVAEETLPSKPNPTTDSPTDAQASQSTMILTPATKSGHIERQVPKLIVRWDCGDCMPNEKVAPLLEHGYESEAASRGYTISENETAELVIIKYRQRSPGVRVMFGFFAGKDILSTRISFRGKEFPVESHTVGATIGMNKLSEIVAHKALLQILSDLQLK